MTLPRWLSVSFGTICCVYGLYMLYIGSIYLVSMEYLPIIYAFVVIDLERKVRRNVGR